MNIRNKTLIIISSTLLGLILFMFILSRLVLLSGFLAVENRDTQRNVNRVTEALYAQVDNLSSKAADWSKWDDSYTYMIDHNNKFVESNLVDVTLTDIGLDTILFIDPSGKLVEGRTYGPDKNRIPLSADILKNIVRNPALIQHATPEDVKQGLLLIDNQPMVVVSRPILKSDGNGPSHGTLVFGRHLSRDQIDKLAKITHLSVEGVLFNDPEAAPNFVQAKQKLSPEKPYYITSFKNNIISGFTLISDLNHQPLLLIRVDIPREIYNQGQVSTYYLIFAIIAAGLCFGIAITILLEKSVISRLTRLSAKVSQIGATGNITERVELSGNDELGLLAQSTNKMLESLEGSQKEIKKYNDEIHLLMDTLPVGLISIDEHYHINPAYSKAIETITGMNNLSGLDFVATLKNLNTGLDREKLTDYLDILKQELLSEDELEMLNPYEELQLSHCWVTIKYFLIRKTYGENHILVVMEDITEAKELAARVSQKEKENMQLKAIAENPDLFREFILEIKQLLQKSDLCLEKMTSSSDTHSTLIHEIFRYAHTIKGLAASFGLSAVVDIAGNLESSLSELRDSATLPEGMLEQSRLGFQHLALAFRDVMDHASAILGDTNLEDTNVYLKIPLDDLKAIMNNVKKMPFQTAANHKILENIKEEILNRLLNIKNIPARKGLARVIKTAAELNKRLNKNINFVFQDNDLAIDCEVTQALNNSLTHLIRNAFDHGIEAEEARLEKGKPEQGTVTLSLEKQADELLIQLTDDGGGMNLGKIMAKAIEKKLITPDEAQTLKQKDWYGFIFKPGFSTADDITDISGRGVGMDFVYNCIKKELNGDIQIESEPGKGTKFLITLPGK